MSVDHRMGTPLRARVPVVIAALALPLLAACSSSSSVEYVTDVYPSQSLVDLLKGPNNSPPPVQNATPPAPSAVDASSAPPTSATPPAREPPPVATTAAASPPPIAAGPPEQVDPVAAAFPSVSLIDLMTGRRAGSQ
jgi:hypothetical protein